MRDTVETCSESPDDSPGIRCLAESALKILAERKQGARSGGSQDWVERLCDAVVSDSETSHQKVISSMISRGITSDDVFDVYLPAVARELGERWVRDEANFVQVTLGTGRLQTLIRERAGLGAGSADGTGRVLMVLPPFEAHALGVFIAADQIRRAGHSVHCLGRAGGARGRGDAEGARFRHGRADLRDAAVHRPARRLHLGDTRGRPGGAAARRRRADRAGGPRSCRDMWRRPRGGEHGGRSEGRRSCIGARVAMYMTPAGSGGASRR